VIGYGRFMRHRTLLPLVLAAVLGFTACAPTGEVDTAVLSEQADDYIAGIGSGGGHLGSGTFSLGPQNTDGGSVTLGEIDAEVSAIRAICFGEGKASVGFELRTEDSTTIANTFDVPCDSAQHDATLGDVVSFVTDAKLHATWLSGTEQSVVVSVVTPE